MRISVLGPLEISDDAGRPVAVSRRLHRSMLMLLLLQAGQPCSTRSLVAALWGDEPPRSPDVSLRSCVYGIRKVLPDAGRLRTHPSGYLFAVRPGELDLDDFRRFAGRGREALDRGNPKAAATLLSQAVSLWREPPLADLSAGPAKQRLLDQRRQAQDALIDARLALGEHRQVLPELRSAVAADPLREHAWAQLITALYRSGARADALATFGRLRMMLISNYGIDPGPELQELHRRVLADDPALMITAEPERAVATGRTAELECLLCQLSGEGMAATVVTGMLDVGKPAPELVHLHQVTAHLHQAAAHLHRAASLLHQDSSGCATS